MKNILSIDFDYFIDVSAEDRDRLFPSDITLDTYGCTKEWEECYKKFPEIKDIGVIKDYDFIKDYLTNHEKVAYCCSDSHADAYYFIHRSFKSPVHVTNIDFHHDFYYMYGSKVHCANWFMKVCDEIDTDVLWVAREDSETTSLGGEFQYPMTTDIHQIKDSYDGIFLCLSPQWTPPHLIPFYNELVTCVF